MAEYIVRERAKFQIYREFITEKDTAVRVFRALNTVPTADVQPVVHGEWKDYPICDDCYQCSICGVLSMGKYYFCSNCGADMRPE